MSAMNASSICTNRLAHTTGELAVAEMRTE